MSGVVEPSETAQVVPAEPVRWRRAALAVGRLEPSTDPDGLIYGMIVATVVIVAQSRYDVSFRRVFVTTAATAVVYWLAHVYCHLLAHHIREGGGRPWGDLVTTLRQESTVLWGAAAPLAAVAVSELVGADRRGADWAAVVTVSVLLFVWGLVAGVRAGETTRHVLLDALMGAAIGVLSPR